MSRTLLSIIVVFLVLVGLLFVSNQGELRQQLADSGEYLKSELSDVAESVGQGAEALSDKAQAVAASAKDSVAGGMNTARDAASGALETANNMAKDAAEGAANMANDAAETANQVASDAARVANEAATEAANAANKAAVMAAKAAESATDEAKESAGQIIQAAKNTVKEEKAPAVRARMENKDMEAAAAANTAASVKTSPAKVRKLKSGTFDMSITAGTSAMSNSNAKILFAYNSSDLTQSADAVLGKIADKLKTNSSLSAKIVGNSDALGPKNANKWISAERAKSVASRLQELGVPSNQIKLSAAASSNPIAANDNWAGRQQNRRVDVTVQ